MLRSRNLKRIEKCPSGPTDFPDPQGPLGPEGLPGAKKGAMQDPPGVRNISPKIDVDRICECFAGEQLLLG